MFPVSTYEEIVKKERELNEKHIIVLLFVRPSLPGAREIVEEFSYLYYNSSRYCSIYAVGYTNDPETGGGYRKVYEIEMCIRDRAEASVSWIMVQGYGICLLISSKVRSVQSRISP